jgi:hypothetical protein
MDHTSPVKKVQHFDRRASKYRQHATGPVALSQSEQILSTCTGVGWNGSAVVTSITYLSEGVFENGVSRCYDLYVLGETIGLRVIGSGKS